MLTLGGPSDSLLQPPTTALVLQPPTIASYSLPQPPTAPYSLLQPPTAPYSLGATASYLQPPGAGSLGSSTH
eukprot:scaffold33685_cov63-Phaeocystis_antarctica.AAC.2